jgi:hypothetical protein
MRKGRKLIRESIVSASNLKSRQLSLEANSSQSVNVFQKGGSIVKVLIWILNLLVIIGSLTVVNRIEPYILGLPFIVFWATVWLILTSVCLYITNVFLERQEGNK